MTDQRRPDDVRHPPESSVHHEPAAAHRDEHASTEHARDMEGIGGHVDEHMTNDHAHGDVRLGPIDWAGWGYAVVGVLAGLLVALAFWAAIA